MCGFVGFTGTDEQSELVLTAMMNRIIHRGPDMGGQHIVDNVALGFRRLSILDLSEAGAQPMSSDDGKVTIVFNGEIYNFQELRAELEAAGYAFHCNADTEVLVHGYEEWGEDLVNRLRGNFTCVCVKAPGFGDRRKEMLKDIAILTGGTYISSELNMNLPDTQITDLGTARQIKVTKDNTVIVDGAGDANEIKARIAEIKNTISVTTSDYDKEKLQERLAKLSGGVAVIKVGAQTEVAMKEQKLRVEDALNATRAAVEEGIVAGGGTAYVNAIPAVEKLVAKLSGDEKTGAQIIARALQAPIRQIAENAGVDGSIVYDKIRSSRKVGYGYNAYTETYCDMIPSGIVDPTKVTRTALENAASIASCVLTTESLVADKPDPKADAAMAAAAQGGGMGGMY